MRVIVFLTASLFAFYAVLVGRIDSAFQLSALALATFILAGLARR